ncbi:MAG: septal ring lytic transglycosylase RlpA family protein, partial [Solirubrobacteraceae bacterium]
GPGGSGASAVAGGPNTLQPPPAGALLRRPAQLRGELTSSAAHRRVIVQLLDPVRGWTTVAHATADAGGNFTATVRPQRVGRFQIRALQPGRAKASSVTPTAVLEVLKPVRATWFGPSDSGSSSQKAQATACGEPLTAQLLGVAHRTLPCGTIVDISYGGRSISVPVVDRGPYVRGVTLDLTQAAAQALGFDGSAYVGALAVGL